MIPPKAKQQITQLTAHGITREDEYYWLRDLDDDVDVRRHLEAENTYTKQVLAHTQLLQAQLYQEMRSRICEETQTVPAQWGRFVYYQQYIEGKEYPIHCRRLFHDEQAPVEVFLDENELAEGHRYFDLAAFDISPDHRWLAYVVDTEGDERYQLRFIDLDQKVPVDVVIDAVDVTLAWLNDNQTLAYVELDDNNRPVGVKTHTLGLPACDDPWLYREKSEGQYFVSVDKTQDEKYLMIDSGGAVSGECYWLDANEINSKPQRLYPREAGHEYYLDHHDGYFYLQSNRHHANFGVYRVPVADPNAVWECVIEPSDQRLITGFICFKRFLAISYMENGLPGISLLVDYQIERPLAFQQAAYTCAIGENHAYDTLTLRYVYASFTTPTSIYEYDLVTGEHRLLKQEPVPHFDASQYQVARLMAASDDGTLIPVSVLHHQQTAIDGQAPLLLYGYGAYGVSIKPDFHRNVLSLVDRGFIFAIAHVRGGSTMGRHWYEQGKFEYKQNSFLDFNACARYLTAQGYGDRHGITALGGSAGGLLVTAAANLAPNLYRAVVAEVPFVDVLTTMLDEDLPLTKLEYEEWGNPQTLAAYQWIAAYSPYDNIPNGHYPDLLLTAGLSDPRVTYWEPAKFALRARDRLDSNVTVLLHTQMEAGHSGASGRFSYLYEEAMQYAFILSRYPERETIQTRASMVSEF
ncbi:Protease 2 [Vibrio stylophorae]|uniref:Protease 2 n=1 Tax=Vibrio stylophorae TaxID=659351 RepID=A0ABM8ZRP7_9VIBR|nr:S9 family peptidase [Vibrio stylophorae]CAH0532977.1 Protease 2 [Vibrio stylophorae]